ncbi:hypothetical protein AURDEDRAFT_185337 [Auricularia subglabra TFB-10046 SS5]|nr:hypothetical protein AURDEDRAFT_185337 [Auricularia subglabra TFB-10046 SS5]
MRSTLVLYLLITSAAAQLFAHHDHSRHKAAMDPFNQTPTETAELDRPAAPEDDRVPTRQTTSADTQGSEQDFLRGLFGGSATAVDDAAATPTADSMPSLQTAAPDDATLLGLAMLGTLDTTTEVPGDTVAALTRSRVRTSRTALAPPTDTGTPNPSSTQTPTATVLPSSESSKGSLGTLARAGITLGVVGGVAVLVALMRYRRRLARALSPEEDLSWAADVEKYDGIAWPPSEPSKPAAATTAHPARPMTVLAATPSAEIRLWEKLQYNAVQAGWNARPGDIVRQSRMLLRSDTWASKPEPPTPALTELPPARKNTLTRAMRNPTTAAGRRNEPDLDEGVLRMLTR